jgi:hypothetical protein
MRGATLVPASIYARPDDVGEPMCCKCLTVWAGLLPPVSWFNHPPTCHDNLDFTHDGLWDS